VKHFVPHALILLALAAGAAGTLAEDVCLGVLFFAHLLAPIWSAYVARRETRVRAMLLGPGTLIGLHAIGVLLTFLSTIGGVPEGTWITLMIVILWAIGLAAYTLYCAVTFSVISRIRGTN
jgi:apolipoprotein N-acyltransferase